jgi:dipeptidyl aminopeptidase/acylaminoacyl peptidase
LAPGDISVGEPFELVGRTGRSVHGVLYPPKLGGTTGPDATCPPLVVWCHGGPTASSGAGFDITLQYFTSRGFAVARVDYAGSTGYGRAYRCSLWGQWGMADAEDCVDAALHLAAIGRVDGARMAIRGGSAGGMTALNALAAGEGFTAAVAHYGVTDLVGLAASTHDFEARYLDRLIGPLPACREMYEARSPVRRAAGMGGSVLLLQGTEDPVVPPAQAERLRDALVAAGRHCVVRFFEGESHGFRRAETLVAALEEELAFYRTELNL